MDLQTNSENRDIAIFGGTFDPIHQGHTESAKHIAKWLNLSTIFLVPAHIPPHKDIPLTSVEHRVSMVKAVCKNSPLFTLDTREILRKSPSYTVDTLTEFRKENPASRLFFIIGMDSLLSFTHWHKWQSILSLCHLVVCTRPGYPDNNYPEPTKSLLNKHQATPSQIANKPCGHILLSPPHQIDISSTEIRRALSLTHEKTSNTPENICAADKETTSEKLKMLAPEVQRYIKKHNLYQ